MGAIRMSRSEPATGVVNWPRVLEIVQQRCREALASGQGGRIRFDDLPFSGRQLKDWSLPAISYRESLALSGGKS